MNKNDTNSLDLNEIFDNTIEGILIIEDGFIKNVNKSLLNILDYKNKDELIGNLATGVLIPTSTAKYIEYNSEIFQEISIITSEATMIPVIIQIKNINLNNKEYKMVSVLDMRELKEKENMLIEQSRLAAMGEMISVIAHQWRQPLTAIASITTRLKMKVKMNKLENSLVEEKTDEINNYLQYMSKTIDDFRNFFEPNKELNHTSLDKILIDSLKMIQQSFKVKNIDINIEEKELSNISVYQNELVQVILNILNNAKDAFEEKDISKPQINITFEENENTQKILIQDNAGGIPPDILSKIFEPYFSTKNKKNGTGLGLYICKTIIEKHSHGKIDVKNNKDGALFSITLNK